MPSRRGPAGVSPRELSRIVTLLRERSPQDQCSFLYTSSTALTTATGNPLLLADQGAVELTRSLCDPSGRI